MSRCGQAVVAGKAPPRSRRASDNSSSHLPLLIAVRVVYPAKGDSLSVKGEQAVITDGDAMRVTAEAANDLSGSAERRLCLNDPLLAEQ